MRSATCLRASYVMRGPDLAFGATRVTQVQREGRSEMRWPRSHPLCRHIRCAMSGTDRGEKGLPGGEHAGAFGKLLRYLTTPHLTTPSLFHGWY